MAELATLYTISPSEDSTVAVEVLGAGLIGRKKRRTLFFENFRGEMQCVGNDVTRSQITLTVDTRSAACRDAALRDKQRHAVAAFARNDALAAQLYPEIRFESTGVREKPLRGFVMTGRLQIRGTWRDVKFNLSFSPTQRGEIQLDGDAALRLSDFGLPRPSAMFGLVGTRDEAVIHVRLWAIPTSRV